jgi:hypothetical protein
LVPECGDAGFDVGLPSCCELEIADRIGTLFEAESHNGKPNPPIS